MQVSRSNICAAALLFSALCTVSTFAQDFPASSGLDSLGAQASVTPRPRPHRCFEQQNDARQALRGLPAGARSWLSEDVAYIISPEERCAFLHLHTDEEREQFAEQFWNRRSIDPDSPDNEFKSEHYRRIAFANEKYAEQFPGGGKIDGWKMDRGRIFVLFGAPDSVVEVLPSGKESATPAGQHSEGSCRSEKWHYQKLQRIAETAGMDFDFVACDAGYYRLVPPQGDQAAFLDAVTRNVSRNPKRAEAQKPGNIQLDVGVVPSQKVMFKDLEAIVVTRMVRDQVKLTHRIDFAQATQATTLARIHIQIPLNPNTSEGSVQYQLFARVSRPSGWVVDTSELAASQIVHDKLDPAFNLDAHLNVPLPAGKYQLAVVAKNVKTGDVGVERTTFDVPTYAALEESKDPASNFSDTARHAARPNPD
jgi:GWxTD domain-containing protein